MVWSKNRALENSKITQAFLSLYTTTQWAKKGHREKQLLLLWGLWLQSLIRPISTGVGPQKVSVSSLFIQQVSFKFWLYHTVVTRSTYSLWLPLVTGRKRTQFCVSLRKHVIRCEILRHGRVVCYFLNSVRFDKVNKHGQSAVVAHQSQGTPWSAFWNAFQLTTTIPGVYLSYCSLSVILYNSGHSPLTSLITKAFLPAELNAFSFFAHSE